MLSLFFWGRFSLILSKTIKLEANLNDDVHIQDIKDIVCKAIAAGPIDFLQTPPSKNKTKHKLLQLLLVFIICFG